MQARLNSTFLSLKVRNYRLFFTGQLVSLIGWWMQAIGQDWLVLDHTDNSAAALGAVTALQFAPVLLFTLYGGKLADRYDKRVLLLIANAIWTVLAIGMGVLVLSGGVTLGAIYVFAFLLGLVNAVETPVRQAFVSELVGPKLLPNAISLNATAFNTARIVGPAVAGVAVAAFDVGPVFLINGISYVAALAGLWFMRPADLFRDGLKVAKDGPAPRIVDGLRYVWRRPDLALPIALVLVIGLLGFNFQLTLALIAKTVFETGAAQFGLLTTALAVGALGGALASTQRRARPTSATVLGSAAIFGALETAVGFAPTFASMVVLLLPTGFFMVYFAQAANQRVQLGTDAALRGRVMALYVMVFLGTTPLGALLVGWLSSTFGPRPSVWVGGLASLVAAGVAFAYRCWRRDLRVHVHLHPVRMHVGEARTMCVPAARPAVR
ncbi:MFS transporter [Luedemannella flava]|uniref:MFS transporter n=1 Tax=Luedemannella flava TaxID=349316 RepID=A0ABN2MIA1_9ACTN